MAGIKETKEALVAGFEVALFIQERIKDGAGFDDAAAFFEKIKNDEEFKAKLLVAYENYQAIPAEMQDLGYLEIFELARLAIDYVQKFSAKAVSK